MKHSKRRFRILIMIVGLLPVVLGLSLLGRLKAEDKVQFLTHHLDNARTGWNSSETQLTPAVVRDMASRIFRRAWENTDIRGQVYGAPLFISIDGEEFLLIATEENFFYALNPQKDGGTRYEHQLGELEGRPERFVTQEEWNFKLRGNCIDLNKPTSGGPHGVTGTGVIDRDTGIWYLSNLTMEDNVQVYNVHAINILDGTEVPGWPITIQGSWAGRPFDAFALTQRGPLTLLETDKGKVVYLTFAARCDAFEWSGWVVGISINDPDPPAVTYVFSTTPDGDGGGIWGPGGISIDPDGKHGYVVTGNGTTNWFSGGLSYSMSVMKLDLTSPDNPFDYGNPNDFFTPTDFSVANARDADFGGSSALVLPPQDPKETSTPHLLFTASKSGRVYLLNRDRMGGRDEKGMPRVGGEIQQLRVNGGARVAPTYFKDDQGRQFVYVTGCDEGTFPNSGTFLDWEDSFITILGGSGVPERAALGTGPSMIEFSPPGSDETRMFLAWVKFDPDNPDDRAVLIKSSSDGRNWSTAVEVARGPAAVRTSPALAVFGDRLYISWIDDETSRIVIQSSADGVNWSDRQMLNEVAPTTYASMAAFNDQLYVAFISSVGSEEGFRILLRRFDGDDWSDPIPIGARQIVPVSAPFIIPFMDGDDKPVLYAFWLRNRSDREILFKVSPDGEDWSANERSFNERANRESGLSGMVLNTIIEGQPKKGERFNLGPERLFILFLTDSGSVGQNNEVRAKSIDKSGALEGGGAFFFQVHESPNPLRAFSGTTVGATRFRGQPVFAYVRRDTGFHDLRLKMGSLGYRGGGMAAFQLYVDPDTRETRFFPAWTAGRSPGDDPAKLPTSYDYLPGSPGCW